MIWILHHLYHVINKGKYNPMSKPCQHVVPRNSKMCPACRQILAGAELREARRRRGQLSEWARDKIAAGEKPEAVKAALGEVIGIEPAPPPVIAPYKVGGDFGVLCPGCGQGDLWSQVIGHVGGMEVLLVCGCGCKSQGPSRLIPDEEQADLCRALAERPVGLTPLEVEEVLSGMAKWNEVAGMAVLALFARMQTRSPDGGKLFLANLRETGARARGPDERRGQNAQGAQG